MRRKGNYNAVIENSFGLLKSELLYLQEFHSTEHFKEEVIEYLDSYDNRRIKAMLKGLPPASQTASPLSNLNNFLLRFLSNFWGHFIPAKF